MPSLGWQELTIVMVIVIIIFGAGKLPEIGGALGKSIKEFKANTEGDTASVDAKTPSTTGSAPVSTTTTTVPRQARAEEI